MPERKKDYVIDVAARRKYRNQTAEYQKRYHEWRTDPSNPFGYSFIHDSRVRTYVDGEGFYEETADTNERHALVNCYRLAGFTMLIMIAVTFVRYAVMQLAFGIGYAGRAYYSEMNSGARGLTDTQAYSLLALNLLEYLLPILFMKAATRMPSKIGVPLKKSKGSTASAVLMMLVIMSIGRIYNHVCAEVLGKTLKVDIPYFDYIRAESSTATVVCGICQHLVLAILIEILLRGFMLQLFRQFGDSFAVIVTSVAGCFMLYDLSMIGYIFCVGLFTGTITIRSGSIKNACIMRITSRIVTYFLTFSSGLLDKKTATIMELTVYLIIFISSVFVYMRINSRRRWTFGTGNSGSSLSTGEKIRLMLLSPFFWIWAVSGFVMSLLLVKSL